MFQVYPLDIINLKNDQTILGTPARSSSSTNRNLMVVGDKGQGAASDGEAGAGQCTVCMVSFSVKSAVLFAGPGLLPQRADALD